MNMYIYTYIYIYIFLQSEVQHTLPGTRLNKTQKTRSAAKLGANTESKTLLPGES